MHGVVAVTLAKSATFRTKSTRISNASHRVHILGIHSTSTLGIYHGSSDRRAGAATKGTTIGREISTFTPGRSQAHGAATWRGIGKWLYATFWWSNRWLAGICVGGCVAFRAAVRVDGVSSSGIWVVIGSGSDSGRSAAIKQMRWSGQLI